MRRLVVICACIGALAAPASALALHDSAGDGTLVVKNGVGLRGKDAPPTVALQIAGSVIGHIGHGHITIDDPTPNNKESPEVNGWESRRDGPTDTSQTWSGTNLTFRAVGGKYTIVIYGSDIDVVAVGRGTVVLAGLPDTPQDDGTYSLNDDPFRSLPGLPSAKLTIGSNG
jgi:hypothetical protein